MMIYEEKLDELYRARQDAIKARDALYHPGCDKCAPTSDGFVQQRLTAPYKSVKRTSLPTDQSNFHDMYEFAKHPKGYDGPMPPPGPPIPPGPPGTMPVPRK